MVLKTNCDKKTCHAKSSRRKTTSQKLRYEVHASQHVFAGCVDGDVFLVWQLLPCILYTSDAADE